MSKNFFVRPYQKKAVDEIVKKYFLDSQVNEEISKENEKVNEKVTVKIFDDKLSFDDSAEIESKRIKKKGRPKKVKVFKFDKKFLDKIVIVVSPTASGKSVIMYEIRKRLAEIGGPTLALSYVATVAKQNADLGIVSTTVQALSVAIERGLKEGLEKDELIEFLAEKLEIPAAFLKNKPCILVDESHLGLENITKLYKKVIEILNPVLVVGFTATPRWEGLFKTINLTENASKHVSDPLGSFLWTKSILTLPQVLSFLEKPGLIFVRSVMSASVIADIFTLYYGDRNSRVNLIVSNEKASMEFFITRLQNALINKDVRDFESDDDGEVNDNDEYSSMFSIGEHIFEWLKVDKEEKKINIIERKLGLLALKLVLTAILTDDNEDEQSYKFHYKEIMEKIDGIPRLFEGMRLVKDYCPKNIFNAYKNFIFCYKLNDKFLNMYKDVIIEFISQRKIGIKPGEFIASGKNSFGVSVYKVSTGFDFPSIRSVIMAESVVGSRVLYKQRAGRGARRFMGKKFFDLIDVFYEDKYSDPVNFNKRVTWIDAYDLSDDMLAKMGSLKIPFRINLVN